VTGRMNSLCADPKRMLMLLLQLYDDAVRHHHHHHRYYYSAGGNNGCYLHQQKHLDRDRHSLETQPNNPDLPTLPVIITTIAAVVVLRISITAQVMQSVKVSDIATKH